MGLSQHAAYFTPPFSSHPTPLSTPRPHRQPLARAARPAAPAGPRGRGGRSGSTRAAVLRSHALLPRSHALLRTLRLRGGRWASADSAAPLAALFAAAELAPDRAAAQRAAQLLPRTLRLRIPGGRLRLRLRRGLCARRWRRRRRSSAHGPAACATRASHLPTRLPRSRSHIPDPPDPLALPIHRLAVLRGRPTRRLARVCAGRVFSGRVRAGSLGEAGAALQQPARPTRPPRLDLSGGVALVARAWGVECEAGVVGGRGAEAASAMRSIASAWKETRQREHRAEAAGRAPRAPAHRERSSINTCRNQHAGPPNRLMSNVCGHKLRQRTTYTCMYHV